MVLQLTRHMILIPRHFWPGGLHDLQVGWQGLRMIRLVGELVTVGIAVQVTRGTHKIILEVVTNVLVGSVLGFYMTMTALGWI